MVYLFVGQDILSKDLQLKRLKQEFLDTQLKEFNLDTLYGRDLTLKDLQEKLLYIPVNNSKRIVVIREAQDLKEDARNFLLEYAKKPHEEVVLVLDINQQSKSDGFISRLSFYAKTTHFKETRPLDTFALSRAIDLKKTAYALSVLGQLLKEGERPERILGGLRFACERNVQDRFERKKRLHLLLNCDIDIKTGRLKPPFALEKLIICLCGLAPSRN